MVNTLVFGQIAMLVTSIQIKHVMYQEKVDSANFLMKNIELSQADTDEISEYFKKTQSNKNKQEEFDVFLEAICPSLK